MKTIKGKTMKRLFDITFSLLALTVFAFPVILISIVLVLREKHPVIFKQNRIGLNKSIFAIYKFQTMVNEVPTKTGKFLRKTGLDEIPQFINVLKGEMSIVGPRALTDYDIKRLNWNTATYSIRWNVKPGISGFAQIYGGQNKETSWYWDKKYIDHSNIVIDLIVVIISFAMNFIGKRRVRNIIWLNKDLK
ncbi:MAG TPA: sugar transferase [Spirochaetota bacterium]|nr:sugar transferase [Spirochaetota bacterium]HOH38586.1 sugar transferase [Spirochaetota bacterium]HPJ15874.1 sugar transferase [Spirochaetota bacterium]HPM35210.1 sugar transferase [Spirochaetota bacterium]